MKRMSCLRKRIMRVWRNGSLKGFKIPRRNPSRFESGHPYQEYNGVLVQWLERCPVKAETWVQFPYIPPKN